MPRRKIALPDQPYRVRVRVDVFVAVSAGTAQEANSKIAAALAVKVNGTPGPIEKAIGPVSADCADVAVFHRISSHPDKGN